MFRKYKIILIHISLSILIPVFFSMVLFTNQNLFCIYKYASFFEILWSLTCWILVGISSLFFFLFIDYVPYVVEVSSVIFRLLIFFLFFIFLDGNKKILIIANIIFITLNIIGGWFFLVTRNAI